MKLYTCEKCHYIFRSPLLPYSCPDCGKNNVREATEREKQEYHRNQKILAEEIKMGLYAAMG